MIGKISLYVCDRCDLVLLGDDPIAECMDCGESMKLAEFERIPPFKKDELVMMWFVYDKQFRDGKFKVLDVRKANHSRGSKTGWIVDAVSVDYDNQVTGWDSDWFVKIEKFEQMKKDGEIVLAKRKSS